MKAHREEVSWDGLQQALRGGPPIVVSPQAGRALAASPAARTPGLAAVLTTSGSTGAGKHVLLTRGALLASAEATQAVLGRATWTCALPSAYVAGFMTLVRSHVAGTTPRWARTDLADLSPAPGANAISLVSTQLHRALRRPGGAGVLAAYDWILLGGSMIRPGLLAEAAESGLRVITTYGMTETCGGCVYDGRVLPGVGLDIVAGKIRISGAHLFSGYLGDKESSERALVGGWFHTSDRGRWDGDRLEVLGRADAVVISGGVNVDLDEAQRAVDRLGEEAVLVGVPDPEWGTRIVLVTEACHPLEWWRTRLLGDLTRAALPKEALRVDKLPVTERGKLDRVKLVRLVEEANRGDAGAVG